MKFLHNASLLEHINNHSPSGFPDHTSSTLSLVENVGSVNDKFTVTITGTNFPVYINGVLQYKNTESITQTGALSKRYYIYYAANGTLSISDTSWSLESGTYAGEAVICTVLWDAVAHQGVLEEERHHSSRDIEWHHWAHDTIGARYTSAHNANAMNLTHPISTNDTANFTVTAGEIYDEDISLAHAEHTSCRLFYHSGSVMTWETSTVPYKLSGGVPQYDNGTGLASITGNNTNGYFVSWIYATNAYGSLKIAAVVGQNSSTNMTLAQAQAAPLPVLPTNFIVEWKLLWKVIYRYGNGNTLTWISNTDYRTSSSLPYGQVPTTNMAATSVAVSPGGNIASTNVQAALEELDSEKAPLASPSFTGVLSVPKATLTVTNVGAVSTNQAADFAATVCYTYTIGADLTITVSNITAGQKGTISLLCDSSIRTITWAGIDKWVGGALGALTANKLSVVSLFHDGVRLIASYGTES